MKTTATVPRTLTTTLPTTQLLWIMSLPDDPAKYSQIDNINMMYIQEMARAMTPNHRNMLIQGMMSNFWYDQLTTLESLKASQNLEQVFHFIFENLKNIKRDFEVKRIVIGLACLILQSDKPPPDDLGQRIP